MTACQPSAVVRSASRAGPRIPGPIILLYHRVADETHDPLLLAVSPDNFDRQMALIRAIANPIALTEFVRRMSGGTLDPADVSVTFDDGYADNLTIGKKILERYDIPATVFAVASAVQGGGSFWWDELARLLLHPGSLPDPIAVPIGDRVLPFAIGRCADYTDDDFARHAGWNVVDPGNPTGRHAAYRMIFDRLRPLCTSDQQTAIEALKCQCDSRRFPPPRALTPHELRRLAAEDLIEIGAHTLTHPVLTAQRRSVQRNEITESRNALQQILGAAVTSFSYPFGTRRDFSTLTRALVVEAGYARACANRPGVASRGSDPWALPRVLVRDWNEETFVAKLREAVGHAR